MRAAAPRARISVASDAVGERALGWGQQLDVREIGAFGTDAEFTDQAVAAYVAKCATKVRRRLRHPRPGSVLPPLPGTRRHVPPPRDLAATPRL
ncbi:replication initiator [Streptomyces sp. NPDC004959]|uniref:replication initiator n=1 Tax=unclassified Streptomyces TaxID=2593676 RepID=UPI0033B383F2